MILILFLNILVFIFGFYSLKKQGGIKKNFPFFLSLLILLLYTFLTPLYFYTTGRSKIFGTEDVYSKVGKDILDFYQSGMLYYGLANLLFILGYNSFKFLPNKNLNLLPISTVYIKKVSLIIFFLLFGTILLDLLLAGINPLKILLSSGSDETLFGAETTSNYLKNFADSLITLLLFLFLFKLDKKFFIPILIVGLVLFSLMGFRYRIILTLMGMAFIQYWQFGISKKMLTTYIIGFVCFVYFIFFITYNRFELVAGKFSELVLDPTKFKYETFFEQTRGVLADFTIIKHYEQNPSAQYDYGQSFVLTVIRILPRNIFGALKDDVYSNIIAFQQMNLAYEMPLSWGTLGEACLHYGYFYIAFGLPGLFILSFLMGYLISRFRKIANPNTVLGNMANIIFSLALFQYLTRGYFPQFVDHLIYLMIPLFLIRYFIQKELEKNINP
jgi:oligosaccharide repeat unit polymerase